MNPHHHWQRTIWLLARPPDIDVQTILVALHFSTNDLRANGSEAAALAHAIPACWWRGRPPPQRADRRGRIGNSFEGHRGTLDRAANGALLSAGDIGAGGAACGLRRCDHGEKADDDEGEYSSDERHGVPPKRAFDTIVVPEYPALQGVEGRRPNSNTTVGIRPVASTAVRLISSALRQLVALLGRWENSDLS